MAWNEEKERMLDLLVEDWRKMPRGNEKERKQTEDFYTEKLLPLSIEKFCAENAVYKNQYDLLIMTLGDSWASLVHTLSLFAPKEVLIIYTGRTRVHQDQLLKHTSLPPHAFTFREIRDSNDANSVYLEIKNYFQQKNFSSTNSIAIDFTGGTKVMAAGLILAATVLGTEAFFYVGTKEDAYLADLRRPRPGAEILVRVEHPLKVFGDLEAEKARQLTREFNYHTAAAIYAELIPKVPDPRYFELCQLLCACYDAWDNLKIRAALETAQKLIQKIKQYSVGDKSNAFSQLLPLIKRQAEILAKLQIIEGRDTRITELNNREIAISLLMTIYTNSLRREKQGKLDMAALLLYRILEMISQFTLLLNYGIDTANPEYDKLPLSKEELADKLLALYRRAGLSWPQKLPDKISLMHGYAMLKTLEDPLTEGIDLKKLSGQSEMRNFTIFAHGFTFIKAESFNNFKNIVTELLQRFLQQHNTSLEKELETFRFITL